MSVGVSATMDKFQNHTISPKKGMFSWKYKIVLNNYMLCDCPGESNSEKNCCC